VTEFSKTFLVFYKWLNLTDVQVVLRGTVRPVRPMDPCTVCSLKQPWSSPKNFQFRRCRRSNLDQNFPRITNPVSQIWPGTSSSDFSKLRLRKSPYEFLNLYGRFCPYNPPYSPGHDTLRSKMRAEIFMQRKKTRRSSITSRKPDREISFRTHFWWQWVNQNDLPLISERTLVIARDTDILRPSKLPYHRHTGVANFENHYILYTCL
jgi:hypothetical protein